MEFDYPEVDDTDWGSDATDWAQAVTSGMLQKAGGLFQLLAELDFGTTYGVKSLYYKTRSTIPATTGQFRLGNDETIAWRNFADSADLALKVNTSNVLEFDGAGISVGGDPIQTEIFVADTATIDLTLAANTISADIVAGSITNAMINAAAAIAYSKLNLAASIANSDLVTMAEATIKGRAASSGTGAPVDLSAAQATAILNAFTGDSGSGGLKGLVPAPAAGDAAAQKFLFSDGTWATPSGSGDVVGPASATDNGFVRFDGVTGKLIKDSPATIVNADVNASAAIAYSKLNLSASIVNADVAAAAAIAYSKLAALTVSRALVSDGSGFVSAATTTAAEIGFVNGVTSSIQTQINTKATNPMTTGGDLIYGGASGVPTRLANGSAAQYLRSAGSTSAPTWATFTPPTTQVLISGSGTTYTTPAGAVRLLIQMVGGGGGGGGVGLSSGLTGTNGNTTSFNSITALGGAGGGGSTTTNGAPSGAGGSGGSGTALIRIPGQAGFPGQTNISGSAGSGPGGASVLGFGGRAAVQGVTGNAGQNYGGGGSGAGGTAGSTGSPGGGGGGEYVEFVVNGPLLTTYSYAVGGTAAGGTGSGTNAFAGGAGAVGVIIVTEFYQ